MKSTDIRTILVIDDSRLSRTAMTMLFQERLPHCMVDGAANADEALAKVTDKYYDLIILDINMPGMDGFALAPLLKEKTTTPHILFLTANIQEATRRRAVELGVGFVNKPVKKNTIDDILTQIGAYDVETD